MEDVAAQVPIQHGIASTRARRLIREALTADGVAAQLDELVARLIPSP